MLDLQSLLAIAIGCPARMNLLLIDQVKREGLVDQPAIQIFELLLNRAREPLFVGTGDHEHSHAGPHRHS